MSRAATSTLAGNVGVTVCRFIVEVTYEGKKPFVVGTFDVPRLNTQQATEASALTLAAEKIAGFWRDHMLDGTPPPHALGIKLGHQTFVPDDYDWRRGR